MEYKKKQLLLFTFTGICLFNAIMTGGMSQQANICRGLECFKVMGVNFLYAFFFFGLSLIGVLTTYHNTVSERFCGVLLSMSSYVFFFSEISFNSKYSTFPDSSIFSESMMYLNAMLSLSALVYTLGYAFSRPGMIYLNWVLVIFLLLFVGSGYNTIKHLADGGCDGGICVVLIIFIPVYFAVYLLLYLALYQTQKINPAKYTGLILSGIAFFIGFLMQGVFNDARKYIDDAWADTLFLLPCLSGAIFITFLLRVTNIFAPEARHFDLEENIE